MIAINKIRQSRLAGFATFVGKRLADERVSEVSASLTFTTLLALVPILTVVLAVVAAFPMFHGISQSLVDLIQTMIVPAGADTVMSYLNDFKRQAAGLTAVGIVSLGITSLLLIRTIDQTFNRIWRVKTQRPFWMQFLLYWALLTFGPIALGGSLSVWGVLLKQSYFESVPFLGKLLQLSSSLLVNTAILWLLYRLIPNRFVPALHALIGAAITALLLDLARRGFAFYIGNFNSYQLIYGAFAAIPVFLIWLNLLWMLVLGGAVLTASLSYWQDEAFRRSFSARGRFDDVLKILLLLYEAQNQSRALAVQDFRTYINMGYDELGDLLEKLARHGYSYHGKHGWVLKTNAEHIQLSDLFKIFVYSPQCKTEYIGVQVGEMLQPCLDALNISLAEFAEKRQEMGNSLSENKII
ncbi:MAG: YihY family inner membrane protein [Neisseria sp.]|nr:YihY family inner membrane protein [Neisseria sp.]